VIHATFQRVANDLEDELIEIHLRNETDPLSLLVLKLRDHKTSRDEANLPQLHKRFPMVPQGFRAVSDVVFDHILKVKRGEEERSLVLKRLKTVNHLWLKWRREEIFEMKEKTEEQREQGLEAKCLEKDRRIQQLEESLALAEREIVHLRDLTGELQNRLRAGDRLVGHLQARLDAFQERPHGVSVGIQVNLPREVLMNVPLGPTQEASMDRSSLLSDSVGSPEEA
ncbi:hypothetical protein MAR_036268, partial [Mya arenaria]